MQGRTWESLAKSDQHMIQKQHNLHKKPIIFIGRMYQLTFRFGKLYKKRTRETEASVKGLRTANS